jgi:hypothetical protein
VPLLIVIAVAVVAGGGIYYYSKQDVKTIEPEVTTSTNTQATTTTSSSTTDAKEWKTYTNAKYGFSFKYPQDFKEEGLKGETDPAVRTHQEWVTFRNGSSEIFVQVTENKNVVIPETISFVDFSVQVDRDEKKIIVGSKPNEKMGIIKNVNLDESGANAVIIPLGKHSLSIVFRSYGYGMEGYEQHTKTKPFFEDYEKIQDILATFTFTSTNAQVTTTAQSKITITSPQLNSEITIGKPAKITWTASPSIKKVIISLNGNVITATSSTIGVNTQVFTTLGQKVIRVADEQNPSIYSEITLKAIEIEKPYDWNNP